MMMDTGPKLYSAIPPVHAHGLKVKVKNLEIYIKMFKEFIFSKPYVRFGRHRSKVLFIITQPMPMASGSRSHT